MSRSTICYGAAIDVIMPVPTRLMGRKRRRMVYHSYMTMTTSNLLSVWTNLQHFYDESTSNDDDGATRHMAPQHDA